MRIETTQKRHNDDQGPTHTHKNCTPPHIIGCPPSSHTALIIYVFFCIDKIPVFFSGTAMLPPTLASARQIRTSLRYASCSCIRARCHLNDWRRRRLGDDPAAIASRTFRWKPPPLRNIMCIIISNVVVVVVAVWRRRKKYNRYNIGDDDDDDGGGGGNVSRSLTITST